MHVPKYKELYQVCTCQNEPEGGEHEVGPTKRPRRAQTALNTETQELVVSQLPRLPLLRVTAVTSTCWRWNSFQLDNKASVRELKEWLTLPRFEAGYFGATVWLGGAPQPSQRRNYPIPTIATEELPNINHSSFVGMSGKNVWQWGIGFLMLRSCCSHAVIVLWSCFYLVLLIVCDSCYNHAVIMLQSRYD